MDEDSEFLGHRLPLARQVQANPVFGLFFHDVSGMSNESRGTLAAKKNSSPECMRHRGGASKKKSGWRESFFLATVEQERAFNKRSATVSNTFCRRLTDYPHAVIMKQSFAARLLTHC